MRSFRSNCCGPKGSIEGTLFNETNLLSGKTDKLSI